MPDMPTPSSSAVTLEVGATYRLPGASHRGVTVTAIGQTRFLGIPTGSPEDGVECSYTLTPSDGRQWVRVIPTPADRWVVVLPNGGVCAIRQGHDTKEDALGCAREHRNGARVARFSFAGWVDPQDTPTEARNAGLGSVCPLGAPEPSVACPDTPTTKETPK